MLVGLSLVQSEADLPLGPDGLPCLVAWLPSRRLW